MPAKKQTEIPSDLTLDIKLDSLTLDEIDAIEEITGQPLDALNKPGQRRAPMLKALAYVTMKRKYPDFRMEDVGNLRVRLGGGTPDPTDASA